MRRACSGATGAAAQLPSIRRARTAVDRLPRPTAGQTRSWRRRRPSAPPANADERRHPDVEIIGVTKRFGDGHRRGPHGPADRPRHVLLPPRPVRLRQDDDPPDDRRLRAADRGRDPPRRQADRRRAAVQAQRQHGLPALRPLPAHGRRPQRRLRPAPDARSARPRRSAASPRRSRSSAWPATSGGGPGRCPAASSSASRSPAPW